MNYRQRDIIKHVTCGTRGILKLMFYSMRLSMLFFNQHKSQHLVFILQKKSTFHGSKNIQIYLTSSVFLYVLLPIIHSQDFLPVMYILPKTINSYLGKPNKTFNNNFENISVHLQLKCQKILNVLNNLIQLHYQLQFQFCQSFYIMQKFKQFFNTTKYEKYLHFPCRYRHQVKPDEVVIG